MPKNTKKLIAFFLAAVMLVTIVTPSNLWSAFSDSDYTNVVAATSGDAVAKQKNRRNRKKQTLVRRVFLCMQAHCLEMLVRVRR